MLKEADACISATKPGPGVIKKEWVEGMADDAVLFARANPIPEILPEDAKDAGVRVVGTGRSDYPNQVNNSLGFPAVFRGALEVGASDITDEMCIEGAYTLAQRAEEIGLSEDFVMPVTGDQEAYVKEAVSFGEKAIEQGVARIKMSTEELQNKVRQKLKSYRETTQILMDEGIIPPFPEE